MDHYILEMELVPSTCKKNLRTILRPTEWQVISRAIRNHANCTCEICGRPVERAAQLDCHEKWEYKKVKVPGKKKKIRIQRLVDLQAVCTQCHAVKHIGFSAHRGNYENCVDWFMEKNGASYKEFRECEKKAWKKFEKRSRHKWKIDTSLLPEILKNKGILNMDEDTEVDISSLYRDHLSQVYIESLKAQA